MVLSTQWLFKRPSVSETEPPSPGGSEPTPHLEGVLLSRRWTKCLRPFPHVRAENVFERDWYDRLDTHFRGVLSAGLSETRDVRRLSRSMTGFDAYLLDLSPDSAGPFRIFMSGEWTELVSRVVGVKTNGDILCSFHHHETRSRNGRIHNDLNPGWFVSHPKPSATVHVAQIDLCNYRTGARANQMLPVRENVRAIAVLFYVSNQEWKPGDGGETGLYDSQTNSVDCPTSTVPPINNSLLAFECTPFSFHSFIRNRRHPRNSFIMWLHRPMSEAIMRWGHRNIAYWPGSIDATTA